MRTGRWGAAPGRAATDENSSYCCFRCCRMLDDVFGVLEGRGFALRDFDNPLTFRNSSKECMLCRQIWGVMLGDPVLVEQLQKYADSNFNPINIYNEDGGVRHRGVWHAVTESFVEHLAPTETRRGQSKHHPFSATVRHFPDQIDSSQRGEKNDRRNFRRVR